MMTAVVMSCDRIKNGLEWWYDTTQPTVWFQVKHELMVALTKAHITNRRSVVTKPRLCWSRYTRYTQYSYDLDFSFNAAWPHNVKTYLNDKLRILTWHNGDNFWIRLREIWYVCLIVDYIDKVNSPIKADCMNCSKNVMQIMSIVWLEDSWLGSSQC